MSFDTGFDTDGMFDAASVDVNRSFAGSAFVAARDGDESWSLARGLHDHHQNRDAEELWSKRAEKKKKKAAKAAKKAKEKR